MPSFNKVILCGHLTRDIEMKYLPSGMATARMGLAMNRKFKDSKTNEMREEVTFVDVDVWGKQAETCNQYLKKGAAVLLEGRLKLDQWDDKATGQKRSKLTVVADRVQFMGGADGKGKAADAAKATTTKRVGAPPAADHEIDDLSIQEDTIPF